MIRFITEYYWNSLKKIINRTIIVYLKYLWKSKTKFDPWLDFGCFNKPRNSWLLQHCVVKGIRLPSGMHGMQNPQEAFSESYQPFCVNLGNVATVRLYVTIYNNRVWRKCNNGPEATHCPDSRLLGQTLFSLPLMS